SARIAARRLCVRLDRRVRREMLQGGEGQLIESIGAVRLHVRVELLAHARGPEFRDVIGDAGDGVLAVRLRTKEIADVVRHLHQVLGAAAVWSFAAHDACYLAATAAALFSSAS